MKLRPCLSQRSPYYLSKHRYYELKHFCLQYPEWKKLYSVLAPAIPGGSIIRVDRSHYEDKIFEIAALRSDLKRNIEMVERVSRQVDPILGEWIFLAVTDGVSYTTLKTRYDIPCGKDLFYIYIRKFYSMLSVEKGL